MKKNYTIFLELTRFEAEIAYRILSNYTSPTNKGITQGRIVRKLRFALAASNLKGRSANIMARAQVDSLMNVKK